MADDILGHEQLDHGKHLHKGKYLEQHKLKRPDRSLPKDTHLTLKSNEEHFTINWRTIVIASLSSVIGVVLLFTSASSLLFAVLTILVDIAVEYPKRFIRSFPIDFEILSVGAAYLAANYGFTAGLLVVLAGPFVIELSHDHFSERIFVKEASLLMTVLAALFLGSSPVALFIAVLFGLLAQYFAMTVFSHVDTVQNALRRITNACFSGIIIFFIIPAISR